MKKREIKATVEDRNLLQERYSVHRLTVIYALSFQGGSLLGRTIRAYAVNVMGLPTMEDSKHFI